MKHVVTIILFLSIYFSINAKGITVSEEDSVTKKLLKCKDVVEVVVKSSLYSDFSKVYVKLTNNRYLEFDYVKSSLKNNDIVLKMIDDIVPLNMTYEISLKGGIDYHNDCLSYRPIYLENLNYYLKKIKNIQDIINNYQEVYAFVQNLGEFPQSFQGKTYRFSNSSLDLSDWESYKSDFHYYNEKWRTYNKLFKISKTDYNNYVRKTMSKEYYINFLRWNYFEESECLYLPEE